MHVSVVTHSYIVDHVGNYDEDVDYVVVYDKTLLEFAILKDFLPTICMINDGYLKLVDGQTKMYISIKSGILEFSNNNLTVLAREAHIGNTKERALELMTEVRNARLDENRKASSDFSLKERELKQNIQKSGAGEILSR